MALPGARHPGRAVAVLDCCFSYSVRVVMQPKQGGHYNLPYVTFEIMRGLRKACRNLETTHG